MIQILRAALLHVSLVSGAMEDNVLQSRLQQTLVAVVPTTKSVLLDLFVSMTTAKNSTLAQIQHPADPQIQPAVPATGVSKVLVSPFSLEQMSSPAKRQANAPSALLVVEGSVVNCSSQPTPITAVTEQAERTALLANSVSPGYASHST
jgi:hypothetical protein